MDSFSAPVPVSTLGVFCARSAFWDAIRNATFEESALESDAHAIAVAACHPALDADTVRAGAKSLRSSAKLNLRLLATVTGGPTDVATERMGERCAVQNAIADHLDELVASWSAAASSADA
jgi:hypothetical protein